MPFFNDAAHDHFFVAQKAEAPGFGLSRWKGHGLADMSKIDAILQFYI